MCEVHVRFNLSKSVFPFTRKVYMYIVHVLNDVWEICVHVDTKFAIHNYQTWKYVYRIPVFAFTLKTWIYTR